MSDYDDFEDDFIDDFEDENIFKISSSDFEEHRSNDDFEIKSHKKKDELKSAVNNAGKNEGNNDGFESCPSSVFKSEEKEYRKEENEASKSNDDLKNEYVSKGINENKIDNDSFPVEMQPILAEEPKINDTEKKELEEENMLRESMETEQMFNRSIKMSTLSQSLKLTLSKTNQLYSLLLCIFSDCEMLISKNRSSVPFSVMDEICSFPDNEIKYDGGLIKHKKYIDSYNIAGANEDDLMRAYKFLDFKQDVSERALPHVLKAVCSILSDPLIKQHQKLNSMKQRISDLKKSNTELKVQNRHSANMLVQLTKESEKDDVKVEKRKNPDVIIQQQRLQRALLRVSQLKEQNETQYKANQKLISEIKDKSQRVPKPLDVNPEIAELQQNVQDVTANVEQLEEERETSMAQRRVSISRMNKAIERLESEITLLNHRIEIANNKLRIMTQGENKGSPSGFLKRGGKESIVSGKPISSLSKNSSGSKIPVRRQ